MLLAIGVFLLGFLVAHRGAPLLEDVAGLIVFSAVGILVAIPMLVLCVR